MDETTREVAKYAAGQQSMVRDNGSYGLLDGRTVEKTGSSEVTHRGDRIKVMDGMVFKNGSYEGSLRR